MKEERSYVFWYSDVDDCACELVNNIPYENYTDKERFIEAVYQRAKEYLEKGEI